MTDFNLIGKIFFAPNTSDSELIEKAKSKLKENGIRDDLIEINYNVQELDEGDLYISYDPPDLVIRKVYAKTLSGFIKMKSVSSIKLE
jgi:undecaprenyl pyrophosphate synthase